ncbi:Uncharacterized membrane protein [Clostridium acidisoli DSM 12555]|jgi:uncharacterized membrane protein|uniref:Uncharacterized membrane protein n=1 Tax=Clostridium acidisoli DSM 12555 TaxID=1121291 RepID=A0A1W1XCK7_9CLOT|nr:DUF2127 domain-containing protein [Clostridium acidisoli]SMC21524.1 Uncharacterized membrane protein [Clostridium acidisoli DSM 12555]
MIFNKKNSIFHKSFKIGILVKGIDSVLEMIGGILLIFLNPNRLNKLVTLLTQHELSEDPKDVVANFIIKLSSHFSLSGQYFGIFYLMSHGIIKLILVVMLWKRKIWAYPLTVVSLILFILYQIYRCTIMYSTGLVLLTIFDIVMIILTLIEYKSIKDNNK